jgi:hypothetical protein
MTIDLSRAIESRDFLDEDIQAGFLRAQSAKQDGFNTVFCDRRPGF